MGSYLVYTLLVAVQLVGPALADDYEFDVIENGTVVYTLDVRREGPILRFVEDDETVLEVEQSQLYGHMYTTYTGPDARPRAFNVLDAAVQFPADGRREFRVVVPDVPSTEASESPAGPVEPAGDDRSRNDLDDAGAADAEPPIASWEIVRRDGAIYVTADIPSLVVVVRR